MKVGCPKCGQHYDVDASMLDRYFRCTECKTLFLGLNAKSVKPVKYKRKNKSAAEDGSAEDELLQNEDNLVAGQEDGALDEAQIASAGQDDQAAEQVDDGADSEFKKIQPVLSDVQFDSEEDVEPLQALPKVNWQLLGMLAMAGLCLIVLVMSWVCSSRCTARINTLEQQIKNNGAAGEKLDLLERRLEGMLSEIMRVRERLEKVEQLENRFNARLKEETSALERNQQALSSQVKIQNSKLEMFDRLARELEEVLKRLNEEEKKLDDAGRMRIRRRR